MYPYVSIKKNVHLFIHLFTHLSNVRRFGYVENRSVIVLHFPDRFPEAIQTRLQTTAIDIIMTK